MRKVFVLEERTYIVSELQWQFDDDPDWVIRGFSSEIQLFQQCVRTDAEELVVMIDMSVGKQVCLQFLQRYQHPNCSFPVLAYSEEPLFNLEWALRELGIIHLQVGNLEPERIAKICRWHFGSNASAQSTKIQTGTQSHFEGV